MIDDFAKYIEINEKKLFTLAITQLNNDKKK